MKKAFAIPNISCNHCTNAIKTELKFVDGVDYLDGNVEAKTVLVEYVDAAALDAARSALTEANYAPTN